MRVLHVIPSIASRYGGPSTNLWPLVSELNNRSNLIAEIATTDADGPNNTVDSKIVPKGLECKIFPRIGGEALKRSPEMDRWLNLNLKKYDLVHIHSLWNAPTNSAGFTAKKFNIPYIVRPAGMLSSYTWQRGWLKKRLFWWWAVRSFVQNASAMHVTAASEAEEVRASGSKAKIFEAPNGLESSAFDTPRNPDWLKNKIDSQNKVNSQSKKIALFLSRLHPKKGVAEYLIPAFARLDHDCHLVIAGGVDDSTPQYGKEIEQAIDEHGLRNRVTLLGSVSSGDRWAVYDGADVFCLPSENENFASVVPEAMARGCRVVTTPGVAAGHLAAQEGYGTVVERNIDAIAEGMRQQFLQPSRQDESARQNKLRRLLSWSAIAERLHGLYSELIEMNLGKRNLQA
jgi:glycosyltransferase involved in cell wall biosynthesis